MLRVAFIQQYIINKLRAEHFAQPMGSAMHDLCMKYCIDLHQEQIPEGINLGYFEFMGLGTVVDSLCAVKQLVFEEKKLTMDQLMCLSARSCPLRPTAVPNGSRSLTALPPLRAPTSTDLRLFCSPTSTPRTMV